MYGGVSMGGAAKRGPLSAASKAKAAETRKRTELLRRSILEDNVDLIPPGEKMRSKKWYKALDYVEKNLPKLKAKALSTPAQKKRERNAKAKERRAVKRAQDILTLTQGQATAANKNLLLSKRIFGKAGKKTGFPANWDKAMTQADKVELSNWLATHWENEKPPRGYGAGMESESDEECDEMMAGGAMIKHRQQLHRGQQVQKGKRVHRGKRVAKGSGIGTTIGSIADALFGFGDPDMELMAAGGSHRRGRGRPRKHHGGVALGGVALGGVSHRRGRGRPRKHHGGVALGGESMADALRHEIDVGRPRVVGDRHLLQSGDVLRAGVSMGGAKRGRGRPRKHLRGGIDWGKVAETALPLALAFL